MTAIGATLLGIWKQSRKRDALSATMQQLTNYETLRSWYLAKLRKSAIEAQVSGQLTPSALIAADREVIEKLIAERSESEEEQSKNSRAAASNYLMFALSLWGYCVIGLLVALFLFSLGDMEIFMSVLTIAINPMNILASSSSLPNPIVLIIAAMIIYVYPITVIPYAVMTKKEQN